MSIISAAFESSSSAQAFDIKYCSLCDAYFYSNYMLKAHIAGSSRHPKCITCKKSYLNNNSLRNHYVLSKHHHYCRICQKHFKTTSGLRIHLDFAHFDSDNEDEDERPEGWEDQRGHEEDLALGGGEISIPQEDLAVAPASEASSSSDGNREDSASSQPAKCLGVLKLRCPICLSRPKTMCATRCGHVFCTSCITQVLEETKSCPSCRQPAITDQLRRLDLHVFSNAL